MQNTVKPRILMKLVERACIGSFVQSASNLVADHDQQAGTGHGHKELHLPCTYGKPSGTDGAASH